jgi:hypothetical protein
MAKRSLRPLGWGALVVGLLGLRVGASGGAPGGGAGPCAPWRVLVRELAMGVPIYVGGLVAIAAPFVAFILAREAWRFRRREGQLPRRALAYVVRVCGLCVAFTAGYAGLMLRYGDTPRPSTQCRAQAAAPR